MDFCDATSRAFRERNDPKFRLSVNYLKNRYPVKNGGSNQSWKKFIRALKKFNACVAHGDSETEALSIVGSVYANIVLVKKRDFKATKNDVGTRRGKHPCDMNQKSGRKRKFGPKTHERMKKRFKTHPHCTDTEMAFYLNDSSSQRTDDNIS